MSAAEIITPDFRRRTVDGRRVHRSGDHAPPRKIGPVAPADHLPAASGARRASALFGGARLTDDFGIPATDPALIADLLIALEAMPWRAPTIRVAATADRVTRVHVAIGSRTFALDPADARLAASALDQEQAFAGCGDTAHQLRDAAVQADWARPYHRRDARGVRPLRDRLSRRGGGIARWAGPVVGLIVVALLIAGRLADIGEHTAQADGDRVAGVSGRF